MPLAEPKINPGNMFRRSKIMIVDDHPVLRMGLSQLISREPDLEVCGEAACIADAMREAEATQPDLVVVDIALDGDNGIELIEHIKARWPAIKALVSSAHDERVFAGRVLRAGAGGYVSKREATRKIVDAIRRVLGGEIYLSPEMSTRLLHRAAMGKPLDSDPVESLSNRELQIFELVGQGLTTAQIANQLGLSPKTVEWHRKVVKEKLNLENGAQLMQRAIQWVSKNR